MSQYLEATDGLTAGPCALPRADSIADTLLPNAQPAPAAEIALPVVVPGHLSRQKGRVGSGANTYADLDCVQRSSPIRNDMHESDSALAAFVFGALEKEKARISRELHDDVVQTLFALKIDCARLSQNLTGDPARSMQMLAALQRRLEGSAASVRRIAIGLRPYALEEVGLRGAIERLACDFQERSGVACELQIPAGLQVQEPCASTVFRIVQEALSNVRKHACASRVQVAVTADAAAVSVSIRDDGKGFSPAGPRRDDAMGLEGLEEWASLVHGDLHVRSAPGAGTLVVARLPLATFHTVAAPVRQDGKGEAHVMA